MLILRAKGWRETSTETTPSHVAGRLTAQTELGLGIQPMARLYTQTCSEEGEQERRGGKGLTL